MIKKRYIVCIDNSTEEQEQKFIDNIRNKGLGWWHYLKNTWLIADKEGKTNVSEIRDMAKKAFDYEYNMVFQLNKNEGTWSGYGPKSEERDMFPWIKKNWK